MPILNKPGKNPFANISRKRENAGNHNVFYPTKEIMFILCHIEIVVCKCFQF